MPSFSAPYNYLKAWWQGLFAPPPADPGHRTWSDHRTRALRYSLLWSLYDSTIYQGPYAEIVRRQYHLYPHTRPVFNSCGRIVAFHATHLMGGKLDPEAGDGTSRPTCLPFLMGKHALPGVRGAVAATLLAGRFAVKKTLYTRWGACLGDVGLEPVVDPRRGLVRLRVIHPAEIVSATRDPYDNVKAYVLERWEIDPEDPAGKKAVLYREEVTNEGGEVVYRTFRGDDAYAWPGTPGKTWRGRWGFVPLVLAKHIDPGGEWGEGEIQQAVFKTLERDNIGSLTGDQAAKAVNPMWFLKGAGLPPRPPERVDPMGGAAMPYWAANATTLPPTSQYNGAPNLNIAVTEREGVPILTCNATDATIQALVYDVPIDHVGEWVQRLGDSLEQDYPELQADLVTRTGEAASGKALEKAREKAKNKIEERRSSYDNPLVTALKMTMTMGGDLGFPAYEGLGAGAYENGLLDFEVGDRPVFLPTPADQLDEEAKRSTAVSTYVKAGLALRSALYVTGMDERVIDRVMAETDAEASPAAPAAAAGPASGAGKTPAAPTPALDEEAAVAAVTDSAEGPDLGVPPREAVVISP